MSKLILHVDDEAEIREVLQAALQDAGYEVVNAADALEAAKLVAARPPDLLIADMQLTDRDGLAMIREFRARQPGLRTILLTGVLIDPRVARRALGEHVDAYIAKTTPLPGILAEIERLIGR
jgi:CheY-like chemotaxis protein